MDLDDLKKTWQEANSQVNEHQRIPPGVIDEITQTKYKARLKKIAYPEIIGTLVCFIGVAFIILNFRTLNTAFLQTSGIIASLILLVLPLISFVILWQFNKIGDVSKPYAETLKKFASQKLIFFKFQQVSLVCGYLLLFF